MDNKKVGTITLEYDRGDGVVVSEAFQGEFNNAVFRGNVSGLEGTFQGTLTAGAINAVKNLTIAGRAVALTAVSQTGYVANIFNDDSVWRSVHNHVFEVPSQDTGGGWVTAGIQYRINDQRGDNDGFPVQYRILLDGNPIFSSGWNSDTYTAFGWFYRSVKWFFHEVSSVVLPGYHTLSLQYRWANIDTNVYPEFHDITVRTDYIRK